jgi:hypothetical protein
MSEVASTGFMTLHLSKETFTFSNSASEQENVPQHASAAVPKTRPSNQRLIYLTSTPFDETVDDTYVNVQFFEYWTVREFLSGIGRTFSQASLHVHIGRQQTRELKRETLIFLIGYLM